MTMDWDAGRNPRPFFFMKRAILAAITCCAVTGLAVGAGTPPKKAVTPAKKTAPAVVSKKGAAPPPAAHPVAQGTPATKTGARTAPAKRYYSRQPVRRYYSAQQTSPTADRYREIQDALAAKGYLKTPSNGVWDKDSMDAMQRFQQDQKLEPTGKLTARSLGALGLGPKTPSGSVSTESSSQTANPVGDAAPQQ
jgi:hypothetical protein